MWNEGITDRTNAYAKVRDNATGLIGTANASQTIPRRTAAQITRQRQPSPEQVSLRNLGARHSHFGSKFPIPGDLCRKKKILHQQL